MDRPRVSELRNGKGEQDPSTSRVRPSILCPGPPYLDRLFQVERSDLVVRDDQSLLRAHVAAQEVSAAFGKPPHMLTERGMVQLRRNTAGL